MTACVEPFCQSEVADHWFAATVQQNVSGFEVAMQDALAMGVLNRPRDFGNERDGSARLATQRSGRVEQTSAARELHAKKREAVFAFADLVNWQNIWMIEAGRGLSFAAEPHEGLLAIGVVGQQLFDRDDPVGMPLTRSINDAHAAAADFLQDLIIADVPVGILHIDFAEQIVERFG